MKQKKIVIIGAGLSGLAVSKNLIDKKIPHILIGAKPNSLPKLGESINPEGTLELVNQFKEHKKHFYTKKLTLISVGDNLIHCDLSQLGRQKLLRPIFKIIAPDYKIPKDMIHVDRANLDLDIFNSIKDSPYLTYIDDLVMDIKYSEENDEISSLTLKSGEVIETSRVFDATNHLRLVGKASKQKINLLSDLQQVNLCHYFNDEYDPENLCDWQHSTNLLRLSKEVDGLDGFAWCVPLNHYLSSGISLDAKSAEKEGLTAEETMSLVEAAYKRRGLDFRSIYKRAGTHVRLKNQYFNYDRAYGSNWMLVGPSYSQVWYMSGAGIATSLAASYVAADFIKDPKATGERYQKTMDTYVKAHKTIDWFVYTPTKELEVNHFKSMTNKWLMSNISRMLTYPQIRKTILARLSSKIAAFFIKINVINAKSLFLEQKCPANSYTNRIDMWTPSSVTTYQRREKREETIKYLLSIISNQRPVDDVENIMMENVKLFMDSKMFIGRWFWKTYVRFIQSREELSNLTLTAEKFEHGSDKVNIRARWSAIKGFKVEESNDVIGTCYFEGDKLCKVESKASNYTFIFGESFTSNTVLFKVGISILYWYFIKSRIDYIQSQLSYLRIK